MGSDACQFVLSLLFLEMCGRAGLLDVGGFLWLLEWRVLRSLSRGLNVVVAAANHSIDAAFPDMICVIGEGGTDTS